jgi:hypothetical protein
MADRARRFERSARDRRGITALAERYVERKGNTVIGGPFAGMRYCGPLGEVDAPIAKFLGSYEEELHEVLREVLAYENGVFVDIGSAEGYYAVGLATASPSAVVHAFEPSRSARVFCRGLARANGVEERVQIHGAASGAELRALSIEPTLVLSDCEGAEAHIFDQATVERLSLATVVIEMHESAHPGVTSLLVTRFSDSHESEELSITARDPYARDLPDGFSAEERRLAVNELREDSQKWVIFRPRVNAPNPAAP